LLERLLSFLPNLLVRQDFAARGRNRGTALLRIAIRAGAPLETTCLIAELDPGAVLIRDHRGRRPVHDVCVQDPSLSRVLAVVDAGRVAVRTRTRIGELHLMSRGPRALQTAQWLIDAYPDALTSRTRMGLTPIMIAIHSPSLLLC
jgi:hypothetical protein